LYIINITYKFIFGVKVVSFALPSVAGENGIGSFSFPRIEYNRSKVAVEFQETGGESRK
jgi:hypothetical protein